MEKWKERGKHKENQRLNYLLTGRQWIFLNKKGNCTSDIQVVLTQDAEVL